MQEYVVHPAFDSVNEATSGFWVGKFESSHTGCTTNASTGITNTNTTALTLQIKPGVTSWREISISNMFDVCLNMNNPNNSYGLPDDTIADPHLMKNSEWGAVAYLSQSAEYGRASEIALNNSSAYITGSSAGNTNAAIGVGTVTDYKSETGQLASTTANVYGVYDMNGGAMEYTAAYVNNSYISTPDVYNVGKSLIDMFNSGNTNYVDVYRMGTTDTDRNNYLALQPTTGQGLPNINTGHYGDAVWETSSDSVSGAATSWYEDHSRFPVKNYPYPIRGGSSAKGADSGIYHFTAGNGTPGDDVGFHVVISVYN